MSKEIDDIDDAINEGLHFVLGVILLPLLPFLLVIGKLIIWFENYTNKKIQEYLQKEQK